MLGLSSYGSDSEDEAGHHTTASTSAVQKSIAKGKAPATVASPSSISSPKSIPGVRLAPVASTSKLSSQPASPLPSRTRSSSPPLQHDIANYAEDESSAGTDLNGASTPAEWPLGRYGIPPPRTDLQPDPQLEAKLAHFHSLTSTGLSFNATLERHKAFRNPHILSKLIDVCTDLTDVYGSNLPLDWEREEMLADGSAEVLNQRQKAATEEREKRQERGKRENIKFVSGGSHSSDKPSRDRERDRDRDRDRDRRRDRSRSPQSRRR